MSILSDKVGKNCNDCHAIRETENEWTPKVITEDDGDEIDEVLRYASNEQFSYGSFFPN